MEKIHGHDGHASWEFRIFKVEKLGSNHLLFDRKQFLGMYNGMMSSLLLSEVTLVSGQYLQFKLMDIYEILL